MAETQGLCLGEGLFKYPFVPKQNKTIVLLVTKQLHKQLKYIIKCIQK